MRRAARPVLAGVALTFPFLGGGAGCGSRDARSSEEILDPVDGGTVVLGIFSEFDGFNEFVSTDANATEIMENLLFVPLLRRDENFDLAPSLAKSWEFSEDRRTITMQLRDDIVWHDGVPTTAADVEFSFQRFADPALAYADAGSFRYLDEVVATGDFEVEFRFSRAYADQLAHLEKVIVPKHLLEHIPSAEMESAPFNRAPVGNGPFRFVRWNREQQVVFEANPDFADGRPHLDRVIFRVIPDQTAVETAFRAGELDVIERIRYEQVQPLRDDPRFDVHSYEQRGYQYIAWNTLSPLFSEPEVRRALTLAIDRQRIVDALAFGEGKVTGHPVMSLSPIYPTDLPPHPYDPVESRRILKEHGWTDSDGDGVLDRDGVRFSFMLVSNFGNQMREDALVLIQEDLRKVGIEVATETREWTVFLDEIKAKQFDACHLAWQTNFIFDPYDIFHSEAIDGKYNMTSYSNAAVDSLMSAATLAATPELARPLWHEMLEILHEEQPYSVLYELVYSVGVSRRVRDVKVDVRSYLVNIRDWWIAPGDRKYAS